jgi:hypothetical protein
MLNSVILSGTVRNVESKGSIRIVTIEGVARNWKTKQDEPTMFAFKCFGDRSGLTPGTVIAVQGTVECREYNGKMYTDIIARDFEILGTAPASRPSSPPATRQAPPRGAPQASPDDWDDGVAPF